MQNTETRILAINPGSRYIGYAVFLDTEPYDWGVKTLRGGSYDERCRKLESFLSEIVEGYGINSLAIKSLHPSRSSVYLDRLVKFVGAWAGKNSLESRAYSVREIRSFAQPAVSNKTDLMETAAASFPCLYSDLNRERRRTHPYSVRMFEAVGLALRCVRDLERTKGRKGRNSFEL